MLQLISILILSTENPILIERCKQRSSLIATFFDKRRELVYEKLVWFLEMSYYADVFNFITRVYALCSNTLKFKFSINNNQFEEVIAYNDLMTYIEKVHENKSYCSSRKSPHMKAL